MVIGLERSGSKIVFVIFTFLVLKTFSALAFKFSPFNNISTETKINHLAIIMDGNRRWAKQRGLKAWHGHREGVTALEKAIKFCLAKGIKILSLYAFSLENFKRSDEEKEQLFKMFGEVLEFWPDSLKEDKIKIRFVGDRSLFPEKIVDIIQKIEQQTVDNDGLQINFMFCYGGQQEIVDAAKKIAQKVNSGELQIDQIDSKVFFENTWTGQLPEPDLIFRAGKRARLSNFMTLQSAYSEIEFSDLNWPEVGQAELEAMFQRFERSQRTFGA